MSTSDFPVVLLDDGPTTTDNFGGHELVAAAIAKTIAVQTGGKAIALEGTWGSGKSSVIRMLEKALHSNSSIDPLVFCFDAWCHQNDPLRQAFLSELYLKFETRGFISATSKPHLADRVEGLRARAVSSSRTLASPVEHKRIVLGATLSISVIALAVLSSGPDKWFWYWMIAASLPLIAWLWLFPMHWTARALQRFCRRGIPGPKWFAGLVTAFCWTHRHSPTTLLPSMNGQGDIVDVPPIETRDRTSLDFRDVFVDLGDHCLGDQRRRLVIVVDNLDRLAPQDTRVIWATLRVFAEQLASPRSDTDWRHRVWLIVPFDPSALRALWADSPDEAQSTSESTGAVVHDTAMSFLDKTFAVRFDVPPLLITDWRNALFAWMHHALPEWGDAEEFECVYRLSNEFAESRRHPPTPRHLKLFINDLAALVQQHGRSRFRLRTLALYALKRRGGLTPEDIRIGLRDGDILSKSERAMLGDQGVRDLACLVFGTHDFDKALELLLRGQLVGTLKSGDAAGLSQLTASPAFEPCLPFMSDWLRFGLGSDPDLIGNAVLALGNAKVAAGSNERVQEELHRLACEVFPRMALQGVSPDTAEQFGTAVRFCRDSAIVKSAATKLGAVPVAAEQAIVFANALTRFGEEVKQAGLQDAMQDRVGLQAAAGSVGIIAAQLYDRQEETRWLWSRLAFTADGEELREALWPPANPSSPWDERWPRAINVLMECETTINWQSLPPRCNEILSSKQDLLSLGQQVLAALRAVAKRAEPQAREVRRAVVDNGRLLNQLHFAFERRDWPWAADLVLEITLWRSVGSPPPTWLNSTSGYQRLVEFVREPGSKPELRDAVTNHSDASFLKHWVEQTLERGDADNLLRLVLEAATAGDHVAELLPSAAMLQGWSRIETVFGASAEGLEARRSLVHANCERGHLAESAGEGFDPLRAGLYLDILAWDGAAKSGFPDVLGGALKDRSREEWKSWIRDKSAVVGLLPRLTGACRQFRLGVPYQQALEDFGRAILSGELVSPYRSGCAEEVLGVLESQTRLVLVKNLRDYARQAAGLNDGILTVFGPDLKKLLRDQPHEDDARCLFRKAFTDGKGSVAQFVASVMEEKPSVLDATPKDDSTDLKEILRGAAEDGDESEARAAARAACVALRIRYGQDKAK